MRILSIGAFCAAVILISVTDRTTAQDTSNETSGTSDASAINASDRPEVELDTSEGKIVIELNPEKAPQTVANFLDYVESGFYENTVFHRVIDGFMIQGGGMDKNLREKKTRPPIQNEAANGLANKTYTIAMARTMDPHSATSQFFINTADNPDLDAKEGRPGYAVFGRVVKGSEVVDKIASMPRDDRDNPLEPIVMQITVKE